MMHPDNKPGKALRKFDINRSYPEQGRSADSSKDGSSVFAHENTSLDTNAGIFGDWPANVGTNPNPNAGSSSSPHLGTNLNTHVSASANPGFPAGSDVGSRSNPRSAFPPSPMNKPHASLPGQLLRNGRYQLQSLLGEQGWRSGLFETSWRGINVGQNNTPVAISEVFLPIAQNEDIKAMLRAATYALHSVSQLPTLPTLQDVFTEGDHVFFVFEQIRGSSLQAHLHSLGHPLSEEETVSFCLHISHILTLLVGQMPPLSHGFIDPEHIFLSSNASQYTLERFSPLVASNVAHFLGGPTSTQSLPYAAPEFIQGSIDPRHDIYSLLATAYYAATGTRPVPVGGTIPNAQQYNPALSPAFAAILTKGLHPILHQRYQHASELRQALLALRSRTISGNLVPRSHTASGTLTRTNSSSLNASVGAGPYVGYEKHTPPVFAQPGTPAVVFPIPITSQITVEDDEGSFLPAPETLPPMSEGNSHVEAAIILGLIFLSLGAVTLLSNFHV